MRRGRPSATMSRRPALCCAAHTVCAPAPYGRKFSHHYVRQHCKVLSSLLKPSGTLQKHATECNENRVGSEISASQQKEHLHTCRIKSHLCLTHLLVCRCVPHDRGWRAGSISGERSPGSASPGSRAPARLPGRLRGHAAGPACAALRGPSGRFPGGGGCRLHCGRLQRRGRPRTECPARSCCLRSSRLHPGRRAGGAGSASGPLPGHRRPCTQHAKP